MPVKSNETMEYLAERIRNIVGNDPRVTEKNMFGGLTFLLDGHILVGTKKDGRILLSVGRDNFDAALARPGASPMNHTGRTMTGFVWVDADAIEDDDDLSEWVRTAYGWVSRMPVDDPKNKAAARKAPSAKVAAKKAPAKQASAPMAPNRVATEKKAATRKAPARTRG
jgi:TfoX/Sxy family transcriptional regulator of competence genes